MTQCYAGIGSQFVHDQHFDTMIALARRLAREGWLLRSGAAKGCDSAFEQGAQAARGKMAIYRPEIKPYERSKGYIDASKLPSFERAMQMASTLHSKWEYLSPYVRKLMARNCMQVLGDELDDPVKMVISWARAPVLNDKGLLVDCDGGTGMAVRLAASLDIPVYSLAVEDHRRRLCMYAGIEYYPEPPPPPKPTKSRGGMRR